MARMKQSVKNAIQEAIQVSRLHPNVKYRIMDKMGQRAVVTGSDWVYRERIIEGWHVVGTYLNGQCID